MQLGLSESARATTAEEARFRINYPNSRPRKSRIIALDKTAEATLERLAVGYAGGHAHFLRYVEAKPVSDSLKMLPVDAVLEDLSGKRTALVDEIADADVIVMLTTAGSSAEAAEVIGNACFVRSKMTTGLVVSSAEVPALDLARTLTAMRPFAAMLVISNGDDYVAEMLSALRV
ncbi:3-methyl-2-oxobutanoate hydroxymethyltransferase [Rhizobium sp. BK418]|uniref:3-methyl-2-oxobutanoate hydroxymethyltransferase n=1 Tax=Rhizobium sp. BK418 TaxID=2512120 RepID=UPI00104AF228|nr:3-methyl-2-oxobutanoate hydroxymethyltransferase [Rhizobium sp. BK418]TCR95150.1 hypothetical protein EV281_11326 [Rhizobium sp. BK418]